MISTNEKPAVEYPVDQDGNYGLWNGRMAECIWYFYHSRQNGNTKQASLAQQLLDDIAENIFSIDTFDYANGLAGIGLGIEWLTQQAYLDCNTDDVLDEVDNEIYKSVVYSKSTNHSLLEGTTGKAYYFYKRLMAANPQKSRYKRICLTECLILLTDELADYLVDQEQGLCAVRDPEEITDLEINTMCHLLILFEKVLKKHINIEAVKAGICGIYNFIEKCLGGEKAGVSFNLLPLIYGHTIAGKLLEDPLWQEKSIRLCLPPKLIVPDSIDETSAFMLAQLTGYTDQHLTKLKPAVPAMNLTGLLSFQDSGIAELMLLK